MTVYDSLNRYLGIMSLEMYSYCNHEKIITLLKLIWLGGTNGDTKGLNTIIRAKQYSYGTLSGKNETIFSSFF